MNKRKIISLSIFFVFGVISVTGLIMYLVPYNRVTAALHTVFGALFIVLAIWHLTNNFISIKSYTLKRGSKRITRNFLVVSLAVISLVLYGVANGSPFQGAYNFGNELRNTQRGIDVEDHPKFQRIVLDRAAGNLRIEIEAKKGPSFNYPLFALWMEDPAGNYLQTLYISESISTSTFDYGKEVDGQWSPDILRRPEALPVWSHKRGKRASDGYFIPLMPGDSKDIDAYSGATPTDNFIIETRAVWNPIGKFNIFLEVNQSYDWNEYYTPDRYPDDIIYSGSGQVGQPALVYGGTFDMEVSKDSEMVLLKLAGHAHHSGKDGQLYPSLDEITTARDIIERILVKVERGV